MLQEIQPHRLKNEYLPYAELPADESSLLVIREKDGLFCRITEGKTELPKAAGFPCLQYLAAVDDCRFYMPADREKGLLKELSAAGFSFHSARELRYASPDWLRFGALTAWQIAGWYQNSRYCGRCAAQMRPGEKERSLVCPSCGNTIYPKLCPVVIAGVIHGDQILLTKYAAGNAYARFALVAGFAEVGETIEETVAREVFEETGVRVKNLRYYKSQPWAYSDSLLFGFFCELDGAADLRVDRSELSLAVWRSREEVPEYPEEISLTHEMMSRFKNGAAITRYS